MKVITAIEASRRLGVSEKTIRLWVEKGIIAGTHPLMPDGRPKRNRLAISEDEVARILRSRQQYDYSAEQPEDASLLDRITALEREVARLKQQLSAAQGKPVARSAPITQPTTPQRPPRPRRATPEPVQSSSDGMPLRIFTRDHGLKPRTVSDHIHDGKIQATERENAPPGQDKWFFNQEQQRDAVRFWRENHTRGFHPCGDCPHEL